MDERRWERIGAASGVVAVLFLVIPTLSAPLPPHVDATAAKWVNYVEDHRRVLLAQQVFGLLAVVALVWFIANLRHVLDRSEGHAEAFSSVVLVSGAAAAIGLAIGPLPATAMAMLAGSPGGLHADATTRLLQELFYVLGGVTLVLLVPFLVAVGWAIVRGHLAATWLGWLMLVVAAVDVVGGSALSVSATHVGLWFVLAFGGFMATFIVILLLAASMLWRPQPMTSGAPMFAAH